MVSSGQPGEGGRDRDLEEKLELIQVWLALAEETLQFGVLKNRREIAMNATAFRQEIHQMLDELPAEVLPELVDFIEFLRFRTGRETPGRRVQETIRLYIAGEISLGRAAELAGVNYFLFEELLRKQGVSVMEPEVTDKAEQAAQREIADKVLA
jgi:predicted HTH domain antitoxin